MQKSGFSYDAAHMTADSSITCECMVGLENVMSIHTCSKDVSSEFRRQVVGIWQQPGSVLFQLRPILPEKDKPYSDNTKHHDKLYQVKLNKKYGPVYLYLYSNFGVSG